MEYQSALQTAQELLDSEFAEVNDSPVRYCEAMGWSKTSKGTKKAIKKKDSLCPTANDIEALAKIIHSIDSEDINVIVNSNSVSDFLCNCVAGHIIS